MNILTPSGYKDITSCSIGDEVVAYDLADGYYFTNKIEKIEQWDDTSSFYSINDAYNLYKWQSVWANMNVKHAELLEVGDIIYDDQDQDVVVTSITPSTASIGWYRLTISGDHSYIADGVTLHNASRYWVGGGSSVNWNATANTNWSTTSGGANNASVPTASDDVFFYASGANANGNSTISATTSITSLFISGAYTGTMTHNAILTVTGSNNVVTLGPNYTIAGTSGISVINQSGVTTLTSNGKTFPGSLGVTGGTITLADNWAISGGLATANCTVNGNTLSIGGGLINGTISTGGGNRSINGTTSLVLVGTGTIGSNNAVIGVGNPLTINTSGTITLNPNVIFSIQGSFTYTAGTIVTTGNTTQISPGVIMNNVSPINWNIISLVASAGTITLNSNLNVSSSLTGGSGVGPTINGNNIYVSGSCSAATTSGGTTVINLVGTGTLSNTTALQNNLVINTPGTITLGSAFTFGGSATLTYTAGSVVTTGNTTTLNTCTLNTSGITWNNINVAANNTVTLNSLLNVGGTLTLNAAAASQPITFTGSAGFTTATLTDAHSATNVLRTVNFGANTTYTITSAFNAFADAKTNVITYTSSDPTLKANITLQPGASCNSNVAFTRINASGGRPIYTFNGVITDCTNIYQLNTLTTVGG